MTRTRRITIEASRFDFYVLCYLEFYGAGSELTPYCTITTITPLGVTRETDESRGFPDLITKAIPMPIRTQKLDVFGGTGRGPIGDLISKYIDCQPKVI